LANKSKKSAKFSDFGLVSWLCISFLIFINWASN